MTTNAEEETCSALPSRAQIEPRRETNLGGKVLCYGLFLPTLGRFAREHEPLFPEVDCRFAAMLELTEENLIGQDHFNFFLNQARHRPCAEGRIISFLC